MSSGDAGAPVSAPTLLALGSGWFFGFNWVTRRAFVREPSGARRPITLPWPTGLAWALVLREYLDTNAQPELKEDPFWGPWLKAVQQGVDWFSARGEQTAPSRRSVW